MKQEEEKVLDVDLEFEEEESNFHLLYLSYAYFLTTMRMFITLRVVT